MKLYEFDLPSCDFAVTSYELVLTFCDFALTCHTFDVTSSDFALKMVLMRRVLGV